MREPRPVHRRYLREFWPAMAAYGAVMFLLWPLLPQVHSEWLRIALALLPVVPVLFVGRAMVRLALGGDELEQRIHPIGLAVAATLVSTLSLAGGFLAAAHIIKLDGSILMWVWPTLVVVYAAARSWASRRYGGDGEVVCQNGVAWHWQLLLLALAFAVIAGFARQQMSVYRLGALCCLSAVLAAWGLILAVVHRRRRGEQEAP
jgi:hypothetical protein